MKQPLDLLDIVAILSKELVNELQGDRELRACIERKEVDAAIAHAGSTALRCFIRAVKEASRK
jgi:hypothetical protein